MTELNRLSTWNKDLSKAIAALGTENFFPSLISAIRGQVKINYPPIPNAPAGSGMNTSTSRSASR